MTNPLHGVLSDEEIQERLKRKPPPKICGNCRRPLNAWEPSGGGEIEYRHGAVDCGVDNPVDPDEGKILYHCDFCLAPNPRWTFPANPVRDPNVVYHINDDGSATQASDSTYVSTDDWASCDECVPFIEARDWRALWARNLHIQEVKEKIPEHYHTARLAVLNIWMEFDRQRTGPPYLEPTEEVES